MRTQAMDRTIEAKYTFASGAQDILAAALGIVCVPDPTHPDDTIHSVYFDTPGRHHLEEKINSDYRKTKVRLRWYTPPPDLAPDDPVPAFLEVKAKEGVVRRKARRAVDVPSRFLHEGAEDFDALSAFAPLAYDVGYDGMGPIVPAIVIRYRRRRFVDRRCAARVALDTGVRYTRVHPVLFRAAEPRTLTVGVLEIKSATGELPRSFSPVRPFLNRRDSFSKYEECWQIHADPFYRRGFRWMHFER